MSIKILPKIVAFSALAALSIFQNTWSVPVFSATFTQTFTCSVPLTRMDWETGPGSIPPLDHCSLPKFDPALGQLQSVSLSATAHNENLWQVENINSQPRTITVHINELLVDVTNPVTNSSFLSVALPQISQSSSFPAYDNVLDFNGPSGNTHDGQTLDSNESTTYPMLTSDGSNSQTYTDSPTLATFTASTSGENIQLPVSASGIWDCGGSSNSGCIVQSFAGATATVVYTYQTHDLAIDITGPNLINIDTNADINVIVTNMENQVATGPTTVTLTLPLDTTFVSVNNPDWAYSIVGQTVTLTYNGDLAPLATVSIPMTIKTNTTNASITLPTLVSGSQVDHNLSNNQDSHTILVNHPPIAQNTNVPAPFVNNSVPIHLPPSLIIGSDQDQNDSVQSYVIRTLPPSASGVLYLGNPNSGGVPITVNQVLSPQNLQNLYFVPAPSFSGQVNFDYIAVDTHELESRIATARFSINRPAASSSGSFSVNYSGANSNPLNSSTSANNSGTNSSNSPDNGQTAVTLKITENQNLSSLGTQNLIRTGSDSWSNWYIITGSILTIFGFGILLSYFSSRYKKL